MLSSIDRDVRLFLPQKYEFLLFAGNFLFSKRLYEIVKREFVIKRIDYKDKIECPNRIKGLIKYYNSDTFIFTSEILLTLDNDNFNRFKRAIITLKGSQDIKFIFVSITKPLKEIKAEYYSRVQQIENILDLEKDMVYEFPSFLTYVSSNIEINPFEMMDISSRQSDVHLADDIIQDIISNFDCTGKIPFNGSQAPLKEVYNYVKGQSKCALNLIYRKKLHERSNEKSVADWRLELGSTLGEHIPKDIIQQLDLVIPVPETGKFYAQGLASTIEKPYLEPLHKKSQTVRSFDIQNIERRKQFIGSKLELIKGLIDGKHIGVVDEAIFTGSTLKVVSKLLKDSGVGKVYFFIPSPECKSRCKFNMQPDRKLLSETVGKDQLAAYFDIDGIYFQDVEIFNEIINLSGHNTDCCFPN